MKKLFYLALAVIIGSAMSLQSCSKDDDVQNNNTGGNVNNGIRLTVGQGQSTAARERVPLTLIVYATGGGNLDGQINMCYYNALKYFADKKEVTIGKDVNIVMQYKFSSSDTLYKTHDERLAGLACMELGGKTFRTIMDTLDITKNDSIFKTTYDYAAIYNAIYTHSNILNDNGKCMMSEADTLKNFIKYAQKVAPADNYILVLDDHGGGYSFDTPKSATTRSVLSDESTQDLLTTDQIAKAIKESGVDVNTVFFNLCLENNLEELSELVGITKYAIAHSHVSINDDNWIARFSHYFKMYAKGAATYEQVLSFYSKAKLAAMESTSALEGVAVSDTSSSNLNAFDICVTDLDRLPAVAKVAGRFAKFLTDVSKNEIGAKQTFLTDNVLCKCYQFSNDRPLYDITDLISLTYRYYCEDDPDGELDQETKNEISEIMQEYIKAARSAIVYSDNNSEFWAAKSKALIDKDCDYDAAWSIAIPYYSYNKTYTTTDPISIYRKTKFDEYSDYNGFKWSDLLQHLNDSKIDIKGNPTAYPNGLKYVQKYLSDFYFDD